MTTEDSQGRIIINRLKKDTNVSREFIEKQLDRLITGDHVLRFASEHNGYYVKYSDEDKQYKAIYAGPQGPESRLLKISEENLFRLFHTSELISLQSEEQSPINSVVAKSS